LSLVDLVLELKLEHDAKRKINKKCFSAIVHSLV